MKFLFEYIRESCTSRNIGGVLQNLSLVVVVGFLSLEMLLLMDDDDGSIWWRERETHTHNNNNNKELDLYTAATTIVGAAIITSYNIQIEMENNNITYTTHTAEISVEFWSNKTIIYVWVL